MVNLGKARTYDTLISIILQVYNGELEDAFSDFSDLATNFPLFRGKGKRDPDDPKGQVVGIFKGALKVYPLPDDGSLEPPKVLANLPSTKPVNVVVRVYVIRVSNIRACDLFVQSPDSTLTLQGIDLAPQDPNGKVVFLIQK